MANGGMTIQAEILRDGLVWPESPRWHDGMLWLSEAYAAEPGVRALNLDGSDAHRIGIGGAPAGFDFLSDGTLVLAAAHDRKLLSFRLGGTGFDLLADLSEIARFPNDLIVTPGDHIFISDSGFRMGEEPYEAGRLLHATPDGRVTVVADSLAFPNGLASSRDGTELTVAETFGGRLQRFAFDRRQGSLKRRQCIVLDDRGVIEEVATMFTRPIAPDGLCIDAGENIWVANPLRPEAICVARDGRIRETVQLSQGAIACMLGGPDGRTLFATTGRAPDMTGPNGRVEVAKVSLPGLGCQ